MHYWTKTTTTFPLKQLLTHGLRGHIKLRTDFPFTILCGFASRRRNLCF